MSEKIQILKLYRHLIISNSKLNFSKILNQSVCETEGREKNAFYFRLITDGS